MRAAAAAVEPEDREAVDERRGREAARWRAGWARIAERKSMIVPFSRPVGGAQF